ncbi:MAG TPA: hypothetical protein VGK71_09640 [Nitrospirota bacterium]
MRILTALTACAAIVACLSTSAYAVDPQLIDILRDKGILDDSSYTSLKGCTPAPSQSGGVPEPPQAQTPPVVAKPQSSPAQKTIMDYLYTKGVINEADMVRVGQLGGGMAEQCKGSLFDSQLTSLENGFARLSGDTVKLKISSLFQVGWMNDDGPKSSTYLPGLPSAIADARNNFFVRYARLYFNGTVADKSGFRIMFDGAPTSNLMREFFVWYDLNPAARLTAGRYLTQFGDELWRNPFDDVPTANYSLLTSFIHAQTARTNGLMLSGKYTAKLPAGPLVAGYAVTVANGVETAVPWLDTNRGKDVIARAWVSPMVPGFSFGGSTQWGSTKAGGDTKRHDRWAAEMDYKPTAGVMCGTFVRFEYMWQRRFFTTAFANPFVNGGPTTAVGYNRYVKSSGWYLTTAYTFRGMTGNMGWLNGFEPVARYEQLREDETRKGTSRARTTIGMNYWINKYAKLLLQYEMIKAQSALSDKSLENFDNFDHNVLRADVQLLF